MEDAAAVIAWAAERAEDYGGEAGGRVYLAGHSAGAYNLSMASLDSRYLGQHGRGTDRIAGVAALAGPFDFLPLHNDAARAVFGHHPVPEETQPVNFVSRATPPFLLMTGGRDVTVWPRNSRRMAAKLHAAGAGAKLITYPKLSHADVLTALARAFRWRAPVLEDIAGFLSRLQAGGKRA